MADEQETIKKIKMFGLNSYEAKIWAALLSRNISTAAELSDIANVPRSRSYDVLESLEKKGFVVMKLGKPIKYLAVPPKEVLDRVKERIEKNTEKHISEIKSASFSGLINSFQKLYEQNTNHTENIAAVLRGRKNIYKHMSFLLGDPKKEVFFSIENGAKEHTDGITSQAKSKAKTAIKAINAGLRMYIIGGDNALLFPISEADVHPDYDLCIWIQDRHTAKFLKQLLVSV